MRVDGPLVSCLLTAGISLKLLCSYYDICDLPHTMHSATFNLCTHACTYGSYKNKHIYACKELPGSPPPPSALGCWMPGLENQEW